MIPITRKDHYLNRIAGNMDYPIPEKPIPIEEFFFAEILGEAVQAPEPLTRYQMYLARIAGRNIDIPYPETRLEYFLAKAAGMDVVTPIPITKEEILWSQYNGSGTIALNKISGANIVSNGGIKEGRFDVYYTKIESNTVYEIMSNIARYNYIYSYFNVEPSIDAPSYNGVRYSTYQYLQTPIQEGENPPIYIAIRFETGRDDIKIVKYQETQSGKSNRLQTMKVIQPVIYVEDER